MTFADASALVQLYVDEDRGDAVAATGAPLVVSELSRVTVPSALWRKQRMGELTASDARLLVEAFEFDWHGGDGADPRFDVVEVTPGVLERAAGLVAERALRTAEAVQLACALVARDVVGLATVLSLEDRVRSAAAASGFEVGP